MNEDIKTIVIINSQLNLKEDFNEHLKEHKTTYSYNGVYRNPYCFNGFNRNSGIKSDLRQIWFYEFSDTTRLPRKFEKVSDFIEWAKSYDLYISAYVKEEMESSEYNYVSCYNGCKTVIVRHKFDDLKAALNYRPHYDSSTSYPYGYNDYYEDYWD